MRLSGVNYLGDLPTLVAMKEGLFQAHGLDITVNHSASGKQNLRALRNGETDLALMATTPLVLDLLEAPHTGEATDPLILASLVYSSRLNHVVALADGGIQRPEDLTNRRIGLMAGTNAEFLWWLFTSVHHIDADTVSVVDLPVEALPDALVAGNIDAAVLWEPWTSRLSHRVNGELTLLPGSDIYIENWVLVSTRKLVEQRPDALRRLLSAYKESIALIEASPDRAMATYIDHAGLEAPVTLTGRDLPLFGLSLNWSLLTALMETSQWANETTEVSIDEPPNPLSWIAPGPLHDIMPLAIGIPLPSAIDRPQTP
ncbi:hypothetical protein BWR19_03070 [Halomonas sp. 1513]|nr:hypothetical protein BWR19_03070 [Halomonas sp. 1513]